MSTDFQSNFNPKQFFHLCIRIGAPKKLQIMLSCIQHVDSEGELKLSVTKTATELHCSREYVLRVLSQLINQGISTDLAPVTRSDRRG